jgi:hypothetical protein
LKQKSSTKNIPSKSKKKEEPTKNLREREKYPYLKANLNTKRRQDYLDNIYYVEGVKSVDGVSEGIRGLDDSEKEWLNRFNKEYYGASFEEDDSQNLHQRTASDEEILAVRDYISDLRKRAAKEKEPELAAELYEELEMMVDQLSEMHPQKKCTDSNNARNRCLLNKGKATNEVKFIPWETVDQNIIGSIDLELMYLLNDIKDEDEED